MLILDSARTDCKSACMHQGFGIAVHQPMCCVVMAPTPDAMRVVALNA